MIFFLALIKKYPYDIENIDSKHVTKILGML